MNAKTLKKAVESLSDKFLTVKQQTRRSVDSLETNVESLALSLSKFTKEFSSTENTKKKISTELNRIIRKNEKAEQEREALLSEEVIIGKNNTELEKTITGQETDIKTKQKQFQEATATFEENNAKSDKLLDDIKMLEKKSLDKQAEHQKKLAKLKKETEELAEKLARKDTTFKVLKKLFKTKYIKDPVYDLLVSLNQKGVESVEKLMISANVQKQFAIEVLKELSTIGIVKFDEATGKFSLKKELEVN